LVQKMALFKLYNKVSLSHSTNVSIIYFCGIFQVLETAIIYTGIYWKKSILSEEDLADKL